MATHLRPVFERLGLNQKEWFNQVKAYGNNYFHAVGALDAMKERAKAFNQKWLKGVGAIKALYLCPD